MNPAFERPEYSVPPGPDEMLLGNHNPHPEG